MKNQSLSDRHIARVLSGCVDAVGAKDVIEILANVLLDQATICRRASHSAIAEVRADELVQQARALRDLARLQDRRREWEEERGYFGPDETAV